MIRSVGAGLVGTAVIAALSGCAYQQPFGLPELTPQVGAPSVQVYPSYGTGYGYGSGTAYGYGYPNGNQPGYGFADPFYAGQGAYPNGYYRYHYSPYPRYIAVPCADGNRDGRCDRPPGKDRDHAGNNGQDVDRGRDRDRDQNRDHDRRARRDVAPVVQPQSAPTPAPVAQQPERARQERRRTTTSAQEP